MCCGFWQFLALEFNNMYNKGQEDARKTSWKAGESARPVFLSSVERGEIESTLFSKDTYSSPASSVLPPSCVKQKQGHWAF